MENEPEFSKEELELIYIALCAMNTEVDNPLLLGLLEKIERAMGTEL